MLKRLLVVATAFAVLPAAAEARGLTVKLPRTITATKTLSVTWKGDTGSNGAVRGGFVVQAFLARGRGACPAQGYAGDRARKKTTLAAQNVFVAGPFVGGAQTYVPDAGPYRLCGYLTRSSESIEYELLVNRAVTVRREPARPRIMIPRAKPGTYTASGGAVLGGTAQSTVRVVIAGGKVASASATGLRLSTCYGLTPADPQLNTLVDVASTGSLGATSTQVRATTIAASLVGAPPDGRVSVHGGASTAREIRGVLNGTTADGNCQGALAFTARR